MPVKYNCPHTVRTRGFEQIICGQLLPNGAIPPSVPGKAQACCAHQYFCPTTQHWEHSYGSKDCKLRSMGGDK